MVEIKREDIAGSSRPRDHTDEDDKYRLVYSKSKVYVNPTAYAKDNIPGFVALVKRVGLLKLRQSDWDTIPDVCIIQEAANPIYLLAWIPESLLNERGTSEWDKFVKVEEQASSEEEEGTSSLLCDIISLKPTHITLRYSSY